MKRTLPVILTTALGALGLALSQQTLAQSDVLKPFRPGGGNNPATPPAKEEAPVKPKRLPREEKEVPKPADGAAEPEAVRPNIVKPVEAPAKMPAEPKAAAEPKTPAEPKVPDPKVPAEAGEPAAVRPKIIPAKPEGTPAESPAPVKPKPVQPAPDAMEPADIVVRPNATPTGPDQIQLRFADNYYGRKLWRDAAPEYERYLTDFPKSSPDDRQAAYYHLAECYRQMGAANNARANYEAIISNFSGGDYVGYAASRLGKILYDEKDYRGALPMYRKASVRLKQPTLVNDASFFIGRCLEGVGQKTEAKVQYESLANVAESNPYRDASRLSAGRLMEEAGQREGALKWLVPLGQDSSNPQIKAEALARATLLLMDAGNYDEATKTAQQALAEVEIGAWKEKVEFAQFRILSLRKDYKGLLARYDQGASNNFSLDNKLNVLVLVAEAHRELGERDAATAAYEQISRDYPTTPQSRDAAYARLVMLYDNGDDRLLDEVNKFLTENPTAPQVERVSMMKAEALFKKSDYEHAAPIYKIIVDKSKGLPASLRGEAAFKLGWCYSQLQDYQPTIDTFGRFVKDFPKHPKVPAALAQRGAALMQLKQYTAAQKDFQNLTANFPGAKEREFGLENLALIYSQLGDQGRMAETFEVLLRDFPETKAKAKANFWIGRAAFEAKDYKKVPPYLEKARELDKQQYFERASLAIMASYFNLENLEATEKEIQFYRDNGGLAETPSDVVRWLAQEYNKRGDYAKAEKYFPELIKRGEAIDDDKLQLARARVKLSKYTEAVEAFNTYLATVKEPSLRIRALMEKADAQVEQKDFLHAQETVNEGLSIATEGKFNGEMRMRAGEIEVGRENFRKALQIFEAIPLTLDDEEICPKAIERAITLHRKLGEEDAAKKLENQLRSKYPEYLQKKKQHKA